MSERVEVASCKTPSACTVLWWLEILVPLQLFTYLFFVVYSSQGDSKTSKNASVRCSLRHVFNKLIERLLNVFNNY